MEEINKKITETVPVFFFVYNLERKEIEFISPQFYELAQSVEGSHESPLKSCIHPDDQEQFVSFFADLSQRNRYEGSIELKANDGLEGIRWLELNTFPVKEEKMSEVKQVVGHILDITEKKKVYDILEEEKEHITNMLNMMAHDLRTPFNRISMIANLLESNMTEAEHIQHKIYIDMLRKQGQESLGLIQRVLTLATLKGQAKSMDMKVRDLRILVEAGVEQHRHRIIEKELEVKTDFPDESVKARVDVILFQQVIDNLLSNAIKYTPRGGRISCRLAYEGDLIRLSIQDTGIGIPEKHHKDLFQNLHGLRRTGLEGEESTGMGLFICQEIVKMHQGEISVESKEGEGATFNIVMPFPESSAAYY